jgi:F420-0:gamma-glutamyl ligase
MLNVPETDTAEIRRRVAASLEEQFPNLSEGDINVIYDTIVSIVETYYNEVKA